MSTHPFKQKAHGDGGQAASLYVHVPFCRAKCRYCGFYSVTDLRGALPDAWLAALEAELALRRGALALPLETIYVGGGTPTSLGPARLARLGETLAGLLAAGGEWSIEANPATVDAATAAALAAMGVNRVTLGAQSFQDRLLRDLGRLHRPHEVGQALQRIREEGIDNVGIDLIYGIPGQDLQDFAADLDAALALDVQHVSVYALSFDEGTPMTEALAAGQVSPVPDERQEEMYDLAVQRLTQAGLEQYELSNFALAGRRSRHNQVYWRNEPYLGLGPGAASYLGSVRSKTREDLTEYLKALSRGDLPPESGRERLEGRQAAAEAAMLGLRLTEGIDRQAFVERWGVDPAAAFARAVERHRATGALEVTPDRLRLGRTAYFVADAVLADIVAEGSPG